MAYGIAPISLSGKKSIDVGEADMIADMIAIIGLINGQVRIEQKIRRQLIHIPVCRRRIKAAL